jgi:hypothetical protein
MNTGGLDQFGSNMKNTEYTKSDWKACHIVMLCSIHGFALVKIIVYDNRITLEQDGWFGNMFYVAGDIRYGRDCDSQS